ncbi:NAD(P)H-dependent amine dehydrogenase family protein [Actinomadura roseirufa]|uniref:NAD(P)H-dependent amine dehydrogenase family protein n=1 Tax=Actinomadura roseirufa TaxID=2094049 RepID=UPI001041BA39|nr:NADP-binding protein [Actinomadura roseirufa]
MNPRPIRIGLCGLGSIGGAAARLLLEHRTGFDIVGAATKEPGAVGRPLHEVVGSAAPGGPAVAGDLEDVLAADPQIMLYATGSFLRDTEDDIVACAKAGVDVVSPCEELAFPFGRHAPAAARIDAAAREGGATVLGTGVNPGFLFDSLLVAATGVSWDIRTIRGHRAVDVSGFGENIHRRLGIGYTPEEFEEGHATGTIAGHVGFPESIELVCERLGLLLDGPVTERFEPFIAETPAPTRYGQVPAGRTEGFLQKATGYVGGALFVQMELVLHLRPESAGFKTVDSLAVEGLHPVNLTLSPGMDAIPATSAQLVNSIPGVLQAAPGLRTVKDLPAAGAWHDLQTHPFR